MKSTRLSMVIPVYNVAAYLPACLESVATQARQPDEIIAVDDGSTDECPHILADYTSRLPQMRVVRQDNGGLSAARNTGMKYATGEWLVFLDSDDRLAPTHCELALGMAERDNLDIALFNGWFDFEDRTPAQLIYGDEPATSVMSGSTWLADRLARRKFFHFVWLHLYRRAFVEKTGLRFVAPWIHEDVPWSTRALAKAERVRYDPTPLILYRKPLRPTEPGPALDSRLTHLISSSAFNTRALDEFLREIDDPNLASLIAWQLVDGGLSIFHHLAKIKSSQMRTDARTKLRHDGLYRVLWRHATTLTQRRRIARNWLKSFF